jgi:hypothetical protein
MSCHNTGRAGSKKKRMIVIISGAGIGVAGIAYVSLLANPVAAAVIPAVLAFAACPAMCAAMGGAMWLSRCFSKKKKKSQAQVQQSVFNFKEDVVAEVKTESVDSNQQVACQQNRGRKAKADSQDTYAIND